MWEQNKICKIFIKTGRDRAMFNVHFAKLRKNDWKTALVSSSLPIVPKRITQI